MLSMEDLVPVGFVAVEEVSGKIQINDMLLYSAFSKILQERHERRKLCSVFKQRSKRSKESPIIGILKV